MDKITRKEFNDLKTRVIILESALGKPRLVYTVNIPASKKMKQRWQRIMDEKHETSTSRKPK